MGCVVCASVFLGMPAQAKMFKWKDENGQTHYGDRIPERYLEKERKELNAQGAVVKNIDRAQTADERKEQKRQEDVAAEKEEKLAEQRKRDRVLIDTYTTERDLLIARDARIEAVNSQIQLSESIIESAKTNLERTENTIEQYKVRNREVPKNIHDKLNREKQQLETYNNVADGHKQKLDAITKQFDGYLTRFNELKLIKDKRRKAAEERRRANQ